MMDLIPLEILKHVLAFHFDSTIVDDYLLGTDRLAPTLVCHLWREIIISDARYWTKVDVKIYFTTRRRLQMNTTDITEVPRQLLNRLRLYFSRAQDKLIDISISLTNIERGKRGRRGGHLRKYNVPTQDLSALIAENAHRFRSYAKTGPLRICSGVLNNLNPAAVTHLRLSSWCYVWETKVYHLPLVRALVLESEDSYLRDLSKLSCPNLRSLTITGFYFASEERDDIVAVLKKYPLLEQLAVNNDVSIASDVQHNALRKLRLHYTHSTRTSNTIWTVPSFCLLNAFRSFPNLESLGFVNCILLWDPAHTLDLKLLCQAEKIKDLQIENPSSDVGTYNPHHFVRGLNLFTKVDCIRLGRRKQPSLHEWPNFLPTVNPEMSFQLILHTVLRRTPTRWPLLRCIEVLGLTFAAPNLQTLVLDLKSRSELAEEVGVCDCSPAYLSMQDCALKETLSEPDNQSISIPSFERYSWLEVEQVLESLLAALRIRPKLVASSSSLQVQMETPRYNLRSRRQLLGRERNVGVIV